MSKPIPRKLLVHSVVFAKNLGADNWGVNNFDTPVVVNYTRIEATAKTIIDGLGDRKDDKAILYVDSRNSSPDVDYQKEDKISFNSIDYRIREIGFIYGDNENLHHLEIRLV